MHATRELATLLRAGLTVDRAFSVLAEISDDGAVRAFLDEVLRSVRGGATLADALTLKGELLVAQQQWDAATAVFEEAVKARPNRVAARFALVSLYLQSGALDKASSQLEAINKLGRGGAQAVYFETLLAYRKKELPRAKELVLQLLKVAPDHAPSLMLAGMIEEDVEPGPFVVSG